MLVLCAHPRPDLSTVNAALFDGIRDLEGVTAVDLYADYPTMDIDVEREQQRLVDHDVIVLQHPLFWYSSPAILKEWQDLVLEHGFAYGEGGRALEGKVAMNAVSTGGTRETYSNRSAFGHELSDLLLPFRKTFHLCHMHYLPPFAVFGSGGPDMTARLPGAVTAYRRLLGALGEGRLDLDAASAAQTLSGDLDELISETDGV
ncbi:NAD(P)H-dependent oxidoreductase [Minwuia sp.]|uniref:NAD(P)H-dependent oxidoreductase n=1 Tax=Minwuia sp. TaxID=2493630 RepID=UPI003A947B55